MRALRTRINTDKIKKVDLFCQFIGKTNQPDIISMREVKTGKWE